MADSGQIERVTGGTGDVSSREDARIDARRVGITRRVYYCRGCEYAGPSAMHYCVDGAPTSAVAFIPESTHTAAIERLAGELEARAEDWSPENQDDSHFYTAYRETAKLLRERASDADKR